MGTITVTLAEKTISCPYCGESISVLVDHQESGDEYIEDCQICCAPIEFHLQAGYDGELLSLTTLREND